MGEEVAARVRRLTESLYTGVFHEAEIWSNTYIPETKQQKFYKTRRDINIVQHNLQML